MRRGEPIIRRSYVLGEVILAAGQEYWLDRWDPYIRRAGSKTKLAVWIGQCADCGAEFECRSPWGVPPTTQRCRLHAACGHPVQPGLRSRTMRELRAQAIGLRYGPDRLSVIAIAQRLGRHRTTVHQWLRRPGCDR
jgi:hypothetical protein